MPFCRPRRTLVESLEDRRLLHAVILSPIADVNVAAGASPTVIDLSGRYDNTDVSGTVVKLSTSLGDLYVDLFDAQKPASVANFLSYLESGAYDATVFHSAGRLDGNNAAGREFLSGGAYELPDLSHIDESAPIADELATNGLISNTRGTIAFATPGGPNSATSEFFINLSADSSYVATRDATSTVFGQIINGSISVADAIASTPIFDFDDPSFPTGFNSVPLKDYTTFPDQLPSDSNFLLLNNGEIVSGFSLAVSNDNPGLVTAGISGSSLTLNYASGESGIANITVSITTLDGGLTQDTFAVGVGQAADSFTVVNIGEGSDARSLTYTDADGTVGKVSLSRGAAAIRIDGSGVSQSIDGSSVTVSGSGLVISTIDLSDTDGRGTLTITASNDGDGQVEVGSITSAQGLGSISGRDVNLSGSSSITGDVSTIRLNSLAGLTVAGSVSTLSAATASGTVSIGGDARSITLESLTGDLSVTGKASSVRIETVNGDVQIGGALSSGRFGNVNGNMLLGSVRTLNADTVAGNFSVTGNASSVRFDEGITGNTTIGGKATTLRLGNVVGNLTVNGAASTINLDSIASGAVSIGVNGGSSLSFTTGVATDVSLTSAIRLRTLKAAAWTNTGGALETITAPRISTLSITEDFAPNLTLTGQDGRTTLSSARINGQIASGTWTITGNVSSLRAASIAGAWNNAISGRLSSFRVDGDLASNLDAGSIGTATIKGNLTGNVTTRDAFDVRPTTLSRLSVSGAMTNVFVQSSGNIGTISAGSMTGTHIFAGAAPEAEEFPNSPADFTVAAKISTVTVKRGDATTFSNSSIAAMRLGSINLGTILSFSNGGTAFGIVGDVISSVRAQTSAGTFSERRLDDPSESITTEDFQVRVL